MSKHYEYSDKQMIFTVLQMAFDYQMLKGRLKPEEDLENGKGVWKDKGFYSLLCIEENTTLEGSFANEDGRVSDYRIAIEKVYKESWSPVNVVVVSDVGFYSSQFTNTEFGCIVNYLKKKHADCKFCLTVNKEEN